MNVDMNVDMNPVDILVTTDRGLTAVDEQGMATLQTHYYPISCTDSRVTATGAIQYTFLGRANTPNAVLLSSSLATGNLPLGYQVTELWVCGSRAVVEATFGVLGGLGGDSGAVVLVHRPITNGVPLYVVLGMGSGAGGENPVLEALAHPVDYTKKSVQAAPVEVAVEDWLAAGGAGTGVAAWTVYEDVQDRWGQPCVVAVWRGRLPGVSGTVGPARAPGGGLGFLEGMTDGPLTIPRGDDPGYSYQECSVVEVDGIDVGAGGEANYTFQVSANSPLVKQGMDAAYSNNVSNVVLYFIAAIVIYFGTPVVYRTLLCQVLAKMEGGPGGSGGIVDYLRTTQNVLGLGNYRGLTVLFNAVFLVVVVSLGLAARGGGSDQWSLYSTLVFLVLAWVIGYAGTVAMPLPPGC